MTLQAIVDSDVRTGNLLLDYYEQLPATIRQMVDDVEPRTDPATFEPGFALPELDERLERFFEVATVRWQDVAQLDGRRISLLDLTGNPGTHTTKTYPSLLIVARALEYIRRSGEPLMLFSPTSANKGTALRDAVLRAYDCGLATPQELGIVTLAPESGLPKLRSSRLSRDPELRAANPLLLYTGPEAEQVKQLGKDFVTAYAADLKARTGTNTWFTLALPNYLVADTARAFFEHDVDPIKPGGRPRLHAHAVSSAFGLLGYHAGRSILETTDRADPETRPASLLVQHLGTPDMVLNLRTGSFDSGIPAYRRDRTGLYRQGDDPHFPAVTSDPREVLDPTFYTKRPVTSGPMNDLIGRFGGDGIVVSLNECIEHYPAIRTALSSTPRPLPADFRILREWSVVIAMTGVLLGIERGLLDERDVVVHGSGWYTTDDYDPPGPDEITRVADLADVAAAVSG